MSQKLKAYFITIVGSLTLLAPLVSVGVARAATNAGVNNPITQKVCTGVQQAGGSTTYNLNGTEQGNGSCATDSSAGTTLGSIINTVINVFSIVVGAVSVIMIIVGGFRYITSGGNDQSVAGAKNTIIYALIGLVIVVLAQVIVHYVVNRLGNSAT